jgi:hypothetical protein
MAFNRNIITDKDIKNLIASQQNPPTSNPPRTLADAPPALPPGGNSTGDDYMTRLLKYVPLEVLGFYLAIATIISSNANSDSALSWSLGTLLAGSLVLVAIWDRLTLGIVRTCQICISVVGFAIYVFATGGWFLTTSWYHLWFGAIALAVFAMFVQLVPVPALPTR